MTFPKLYSLSNQKEGTVCDLFLEVGDTQVWNLLWRRTLFQWEEVLVFRLREVLELVALNSEEDRWVWVPDLDGSFSVKSAYNLLVKELWTDNVLEGELAEVFDHLWESPTPSKVIAFSWQLLYDRTPTRFNLGVRGVILAEKPWECVGCVGNVETSNHLFLHYPCAMKIWGEIFNWLGLQIIIPPSIPSLFEVIRGSTRNTKIRKGFLMIWHATLWAIWKARNSAIFSSSTYLPEQIVDDIKVLSWKWSLGRQKILPCLFYKWSWDPGDCLSR
jgi:hypothetical protein